MIIGPNQSTNKHHVLESTPTGFIDFLICAIGILCKIVCDIVVLIFFTVDRQDKICFVSFSFERAINLMSYVRCKLIFFLTPSINCRKNPTCTKKTQKASAFYCVVQAYKLL